MNLKEIPIKEVTIRENHRVKVEDTNIHELMSSIKQHGLQQAIGVTGKPGDYTLVFGSRRLIACTKLGLKSIHANVMGELEAKQFLIINLTENIQRENPSFAEMGRTIEQLKKLGLDIKQVAARIGIEPRKCSDILDTYTRLPSSHRGKVKFGGKGRTTAVGEISAGVAMKVVSLKKQLNLSDPTCRSLLDNLGKKDLPPSHLSNLALLMDSGFKFEDALKKVADYQVCRPTLVAARGIIQQLMTKHNCTMDVLFQKIVFGQIPPIPKPDFIKLGK